MIISLMSENTLLIFIQRIRRRKKYIIISIGSLKATYIEFKDNFIIWIIWFQNILYHNDQISYILSNLIYIIIQKQCELS